jgi:hypothetical protein
VSDERVTAFLNWLTEGGRVRFEYDTRTGSPGTLRLGAREVDRSDLARVARRWPEGGDMSLESSQTLAGMAVARVSVTVDRERLPGGV